MHDIEYEVSLPKEPGIRERKIVANDPEEAAIVFINTYYNVPLKENLVRVKYYDTVWDVNVKSSYKVDYEASINRQFEVE